MDRDFSRNNAFLIDPRGKARDYWLSRLSGDLVKSIFPYDFKKKGVGRNKFETVEGVFTGEIFEKLMKFRNESDHLLHMILAAIVVALLDKYTDMYEGNGDFGDNMKPGIIIGAPIYKQEVEGTFINSILPLRHFPDENMTFKELLIQVRQTVMEAVENQNYPMETLLYQLNIPFAETDDFPLFDVVVTLDNIHDTSYLRHIHHNISFAFCRNSDHIDIRLDFNTRCYKRETAGQIMEQLKNVARQCAARIDIPLGEIDLLSEEERRRLCEDFNETALEYPQDKTFVELFETQVAKMPDSIAVMGESLLGDIQLSYGETNAKSNQLAWILREKGVKPGVIVGIVMERSVEMVVAITAVLKAGGAYFPIDTRLPEKRIITMLEDSGAIILLTYSDVVKNFSYTTLQGLQRMHISIQATLTSPRPQILNLNDQPFADRSLIDYEKYNQDIGQAMVKNAITIQATRGCPYNCAYCHKIWSKRHVYRSAENIFEEVKLYYDMGVRRFGFIDDIFNLNARNSSRFFQLVIKNRLDVQLYFPNGIRTDILTADYIDLMIEAGVVNLAMALETASPRLQNLIGKNLDLDKFRRNIEYICHQYPGVISELFTMHGFPTETEEEALGTLNFVKSLKWIHFPYINILKIYPGTDMEKLALDNGISREAIIRSEKSHHIEFSDNLPFEKSFTSAYQASLLNDYFLLKERLLKLLPLQMKVLSPEEIILKYNSYLPETIKSIDDIFVHTGLSKNEHIIPGEDNKYTIYSAPVAGFNEKLKSHFPVKKPFSGALKVLLLDVSQPFSDLKRTMQYSVTEAPLGLMYLLTSLFQEFGNRIHGKIAKSGVDFDNYTDLKLLLQEFKPDVIGLRTLIFYKNFFHAVIGMIRHWGYEGPIIAGGPYTTGSHQTMLQDRNIDLAVLGEGENSFNELIRKIIANGGKLPAPEVLREIPGLAFIPARKGTAREILVLDHCKEIFSRYSSANLPHIHRVEDPAYVIATSGSTGKPKGTLIGHRNLVNLAVGLNERIYRRYPGGLNVGLVAPFFFDASIKQVFVALLLGHRLCIVPDCARGDGDELLKFYNSRQIDISDGTPTLIQLLLESAPKNRGNQLAVKHFLIGGEALLKQPVVDFINRFGKPGVEWPIITNLYGPSECTVDSTSHEVTGENLHCFDFIPIGKPMPNTRIYILNSGKKWLPSGIPGEICVAGLGVGMGYLNQPELTAEKFIFFPNFPLYRTGDLGRWLPDGNIEFSGRIDHQVKIRGYRIELGEIENRLLAHKAVKEAVVILKKDRDGDGDLCAYFTPAFSGRTEGKETHFQELKQFLAEALPDYMIPLHFVQLEKMPLTRNGKIDRDALPKPGIDPGEGKYAAPRDRIEEQLVEIWADVLKIGKEELGIDSNFFELGGHSLKAAILVSRIHKLFAVRIPLDKLFQAPYIREFAAYIKESGIKHFNAIPAQEKKDYYPLTSQMRRLYFELQIDPESVIYNMIMTAVLEGNLQRQKLDETFRKLIRRHEALRTSFATAHGELVMKVHDEVDFEIEDMDIQREPEAILNAVNRRFDLFKAPLFRVGLAKKGENEHVLAICISHTIADGTSQGLMLKDLMMLYEGKDPAPLRIQYKDFSQWQKTGEIAKSMRKQETYWLNRFSGEIPLLDLPLDFPRPPVKSFKGAVIHDSIGPGETKRLNEFVKSEKDATLYMALLTVYNLVLFKLSGQEDIIVGTPMAGRKNADLEFVLGMFVNTVALRNYPAGDKTAREFFNEVKTSTFEALENQDSRFENLVEQVNITRRLDRTPLFDVFFALQNWYMPTVEVPGLRLRPFDVKGNISRFDMGFHIFHDESQLNILVEYSTQLFKESTIERFIDYFKRALLETIQNPAKRISEINIISEEEMRKILYEFNETEAEFPGGKTIHGLFAEQVENAPDRIALVGHAGLVRPVRLVQRTYRQLNEQSGQLAGLLIEKGVLPDTIVGIMMERSPEMVIGILGILKAGGAYLPIDPEYPEDRINYMLKDSNAKVLIINKSEIRNPKLETNSNKTNSNDQNKNQNSGAASVLDFEHLNSSSLKGRPRRGLSCFDIRASNLIPSNLAYVIYTSGTTGRPKGVMVEHRGLVNYIWWAAKKYVNKEKLNFPFYSSISFDLTVTSIFTPLITGNTVIIYGAKDIELSIDKIIDDNKAGSIKLTPSHLKLIREKKLNVNSSILKHLIVGGENFEVSLARDIYDNFGGRIEIYNEYGPTEAVVGCMIYRFDPGKDNGESVLIGIPIDNIKIYVLDKYLKAVPIGVLGEIHIGADGLARGYLNREESTFEKFVENPFIPGQKMYKTGDLARYLPDGNIEFLGRCDHQVKIRGYRIELGEIENELSRHNDIKETVVVARENGKGNYYLCAYIVCRNKLELSPLREYLGKRLPDYMIPSYFVNIEKIPLTANGKINRKALPDPRENSLEDNIECMPPQNAVEKILAEIWTKVLGRENVGINQNFFAIGGDSIKSIQIISRMSSAGYKLEMKDIFQYPVISDLAPRIKKMKRFPDQSTVAGTIPLTPIQETFFNESHIEPYHYNQSVMLYSKDGFDREAIKEVFSRIQEHHDALRMTYQKNNENGEIIQIAHGLDYPISLQEYDLRNCENCFEELNTNVNRMQAGIKLENGPMMQLGLFHLEDGDRLLIAIHHLVIDGVSWRILFEDIETLYKQYQRGEKLVLPPKSDSFKLWAEELTVYANSKTFLKEKTYWQKIESVEAPLIPKDFEVDDNYVKDTGSVSFTIGEEETNLLLTKVNAAYKTEINDILLTALGMGMKKTFGHDRVLVALEGHGREEILEGIDIGRTVGWFTSLYPVVMDISYSDHPGRQIKEIKEILRQIPNKGIGYGILKYLTGEENKKDIGFKLKPQISFNYLGQFDADVKQLSSFEMAKESAGYWQSLNNRREYLLDVSGMTADNRLTMTVSYNKTHFKPGTMATLAGNFEAELRQLIAFCCTIESIEHTPSDFTYKGLTIERIDRLTALYPDLEDLYTLTPMQEGMLYHALSDNSSYFYFEQMSYRLLGELDICRVEKSLNELFKRHDILRTAFVYEDIERPIQVVLKDRTSDFYYEDIIENRDREGKEVFIAEFKEKDKKRSFDLSKGVLMRVSIIRLDNSEYEFTWSFHHILMDGWCIGILNKEFFEIYTGYLENRPYQLPAVKPYRAYIQWLEKQDKEESARYWENYLDSYEGQSGVPRIQPMKKGETGYRKGTVALEFDMEKTAGLNRLAAVNHVTLNIVTQALWGILLGKYNGKEDVVFGAVVSGRPSELEGVESMVGLFINTIPVRIRFEEKMEFYRLLRQVREEALAGEPYHYHPLAEIQARTSLRHNLIDHLLVFENYPIVDQIDGHEKEKNKSSRFPLKIRNIDVFEQNNYNFTVSLSATDRLTIVFKYNNNVYDRNNVEMIAGHFKLLFNQVIENRGLEIRDLTILSAEEKSRVLYEFNGTEMDYPTNKTIQQLFEEQAERTPDHIITVGTGGETKKGSKEAVHLSYRELNNRSNRTANRLMAKDVKPGAIIGIMVEPTLEMVVGITGILKAGGVFLPIEPGSPVDRVNCVLDDSNAGILLTQVHLPAAFKTNIEIIHIEDCAVNTGESPNIINGTGPADPLYVIYTSGTTGRPKGVLIAHKNIVNYVYWFVQTIKLTANDRAILTSSFAFDALYTQFFSSLLTGCELHVIPRETFLFAERLLNYLRKNKITYIKVTPSLFNLIADSPGFSAEMLRGLRFVMLGGEAINVQDVEKAHERCPHLRMMNHYGPTETTIGSIARFLDFDNFEEYKSVPTIGKPINNTRVYILDKSFNMVPIGVVGGLFIEGDGVGMGYLNRPELTAERFLKNNRSYGSYRTYILYCTGDLARWHVDGNIEFLGRADDQVKIRGYRIEPGEIENRLLKYDNVKEAVVLVREKKNGEKYLCAYYVSGKEIEAALLHEFLSAGLPQPMVPSYFVHLEKLPLTRHNKLNRGALPEPLTESEGGSGYAAPGDEVQVKLVEIWASVLGIEKSIIGIDDNFFQLGGHSLKSVLLVAKIHKELNTKISLEEVFRTPTIKGLAGYIRGAGRDEYTGIEPVEEKEYYELSHAQKRLWVLNRLEKDLIAYNIPAHIEFENLNRGAFEKTVEIIVRRHEILRTTFITVNGEPKQKIHHYEDLDATVDYIDLRKEKDREKTIKTLMDKEKNTPFNLETGPLFRIRMLHAEENRILVLYTLHHIISDGWSMDVMKNEFMTLYEAFCKGKENPLPWLSIQYKDYTHWHLKQLSGENLRKHQNYWLSRFEGKIPALELPIDYPRAELRSFAGEFILFSLSENGTAQLKRICKEFGTTLFITLLSVVKVFLYRYTGQTDIIVGTPAAGRDHKDLENQIGFYVNMLPLRNKLKKGQRFRDVLQMVSKSTLEALEHQVYPFDRLVHELKAVKNMGRNPLVDVVVSFINAGIQGENTKKPGSKETNGGDDLSESGTEPSKHDLIISFLDQGNRIRVQFRYNPQLFKKERIMIMKERFVSLINDIISNVDKEIDNLNFLVVYKKKQTMIQIEGEF